ncbi:hypothetical protein EX30DRAFT_320782 [Ascodesmis nigricans]|uniref:Protein BNI4 n=1 Tax=Ascodesmis nigricans TaxID=341454 RepID=A0A4V3SIE8_9PEZI|nr:hypothetical protein EX30DRAFT_320782 [Ascodesmis nigricans]
MGNRQPTSRPNPRPLSTATLQPATPPGITSPTRAAPERYKKVNRRPESVVLQPAHLNGVDTTGVYASTNKAHSSPALPQNLERAQNAFIGDYAGQLRTQSVDDMHTYVPPAARYVAQNRRRSVGPGSITAENFQTFLREELARSQTKPGEGGIVMGAEFQPPQRPGSRRTGSTDSSGSGTSSRASSTRGNSMSSSTSAAPSNASAAGASQEINPSHVPPRGSSTDANKRSMAPSPLSKPVTLGADSANIQKAAPTTSGSKFNASPENPTPLNDVQKKGMKNRLRRAFSFGSAAELRKASAANLRGAAAHGRPSTQAGQNEEDPEIARIARKQEASGLGESIYQNGQGNIFTGSTDNISVSSTASSASIMIRKMGKGLRRSSRSFVGIFRPKSAVGVPAADEAVAKRATESAVSMVSVEAEREAVNVNVHPSDKQGGVTDFPKLEQNSMDASERTDVPGSSDGDSARARRQSITGTDKERAEILASMKKGILKRSGSASPIIRAADRKGSFSVPDPSTLGKDGEEYFQPGKQYPSNSTPSSPSSATKFSVKFSPRITFFDTWTANEYDRRGEIATCNRLTPMLAQQIKEELNTFKMEMDVHEESKVYTHFF